MARRRIEDQTQRAIMQWLDLLSNSGRIYAFHVPNGGFRTRIGAAILKGLGVKAGVLDICVIWRGGVGFLEVKAPKGRVSLAQKTFIDRMRTLGVQTAVVHDVTEAEAALRAWGVMRITRPRNEGVPT